MSDWLDEPWRHRLGPETCPTCRTKWSLLCRDRWHLGTVQDSGR